MKTVSAVNYLHLYDYSYCVKDFIIKHQKNSTNTYTLRLYLHIDSINLKCFLNIYLDI